jgi:hypothetical protein
MMTGDSHLVLVLDQELDSLNRGGSGLGDSGGDTSHHEVDYGSSRKTKSEARHRDPVSDPSHDQATKPGVATHWRRTWHPSAS